MLLFTSYGLCPAYGLSYLPFSACPLSVVNKKKNNHNICQCPANLQSNKFKSTSRSTMPHLYTAEEYVDMIFAYGAARGNGLRAQEEYRTLFPNRQRYPDRRTIENSYRIMRETGSIPRQPILYAGRARRDVDDILDIFDDNPSTSTRRASNQLGISHSTVFRAIREDNRYPYHLTTVQELLPRDMELRMAFGRWYVQQCHERRNFPDRIIWTDEATFTRAGIFNSRNSHLWSHDNPHGTREHHFQHQFSVNVWLGVCGQHMTQPVFLPGRLNSIDFYNLLQTDISTALLEAMQPEEELWWQMDGCPAHNARRITNWLNQHYPGRWIGRYGSVHWPARSPDLTPLDFYVWGRLKSEVYRVPIQDIDHLIARIRESCAAMRANHCEIQRATSAVLTRCRQCILQGGGQFQQLF